MGTIFDDFDPDWGMASKLVVRLRSDWLSGLVVGHCRLGEVTVANPPNRRRAAQPGKSALGRPSPLYGGMFCRFPTKAIG